MATNPNFKGSSGEITDLLNDNKASNTIDPLYLSYSEKLVDSVKNLMKQPNYEAWSQDKSAYLTEVRDYKFSEDTLKTSIIAFSSALEEKRSFLYRRVEDKFKNVYEKIIQSFKACPPYFYLAFDAWFRTLHHDNHLEQLEKDLISLPCVLKSPLPTTQEKLALFAEKQQLFKIVEPKDVIAFYEKAREQFQLLNQSTDVFWINESIKNFRDKNSKVESKSSSADSQNFETDSNENHPSLTIKLQK